MVSAGPAVPLDLRRRSHAVRIPHAPLERRSEARRRRQPPPAAHGTQDRSRMAGAAFARGLHVTREHGTERAFSSEMCSLLGPGRYQCVGCGTLLFDATEKFESGTGWPSFTQPVSPDVIAYKIDRSYGMERVETQCNVCEAHLGHVFPDGPAAFGAALLHERRGAPQARLTIPGQAAGPAGRCPRRTESPSGGIRGSSGGSEGGPGRIPRESPWPPSSSAPPGLPRPVEAHRQTGEPGVRSRV